MQISADPLPATPVNHPTDTDTLVIGAGQAGLALSYWLRQTGVEHQLLERRETLGGAWQDRCDAFCLNTPNFSLTLPGMPYGGPEPEAFMPRDDLIGYFRHYAESIGAPVRTGTDVTRIATADGGGFSVETTQGSWRARHVVLATGGYQTLKIPAVSAKLPGHIVQLHTDAYRNPGQLPDGAVLIVGTGQSGGQIAEELLAAGREIHLAVSTCPEAPRRYRGRDLLFWMMHLAEHGPTYGLNGLTVGQLPSPAARFACNPLVSGAGGGHDIHLRDLGRRGVRLHGHLEAADDGELTFSDDLPERLGIVESVFDQRMQPMFDAYIAATGLSAPAADPPRVDDWLPPSEPPRLNLAAANVTSVIWATGYRLDFSILDFPVLDEWNYPRHSRGVTEQPGLYAVGLPWLTGHGSSIVAGVGRDAKYIAEHIAGRVAGHSAGR
jgi:putative flavoprotein involved in K+ transport